MGLVSFYTEDFRVVEEWDEIGEVKIRAISVDVFGLGALDKLPFIAFEKYDKYMFQKYGVALVGGGQATWDAFRGFQVGGFTEGVGWIVMNVDFPSRKILFSLSKDITSIAIKDGVK